VDKKSLIRALRIVGNGLIVLGILFLIFTFGPAAREEVSYQTKKVFNVQKELEPLNKDFSVVIPKIGATAPVFKNIDPFNKDAYLPVLYKGIAHAKGTSFPGEGGNTYLFAHSTDAFYNVGRYNAVFYLLGKLEQGDEVDVYYKDEKYVYEVTDKKVVDPSAIEYLGKGGDGEILTLQTCYPPGTTLDRLVVIARKKEI
jgi:sortase A